MTVHKLIQQTFIYAQLPIFSVLEGGMLDNMPRNIPLPFSKRDWLKQKLKFFEEEASGSVPQVLVQCSVSHGTHMGIVG